ncbi:uncharacterized protein BT62DRAFT_991693 [Guyanagaster necrorhizus]|uniref:MYND-type domain-containing protein n=1 Tax=Guyanagaster necrorhizus TaxID=856835 RepID=A0A9P8AYH3_9AGAR|nr:uncharacterized protein BT62DRAFT_991693 [Guyanagaster necrorhizus MCA 3950]KAG7450922.1 hypothetical protein BT62DRAFT_991693 [Guyanagaster necrorhizus MCA 3950]
MQNESGNICDMNIASLKRAARNGSIPAMKELATRAMQKNHLLAQVFPLVQQRLSDVPTRDEASTQMALICFDSLIYGLENDLIGNSAALLLPLWHSIHPWLSFFVTQYHLDLTESAVDDHEALLKSAKLVYLFSRIPEVLSLLTSVPRLVGCIFKMSLIAASVDYDSDIFISTSKTITLVTAAADQLDQGWQVDVSHVLTSEAPANLALCIVQRLIELVEKPQILYPDLIARLETMLICSGNDGKLRLQFFSKKSVAWVTFVMGRLTRTRNLEPINLPQARRAMYLSVMYLKKNLRCGFTWVSDALDKGILQSIVKAQPYLAYEHQCRTDAFTMESMIVEILDTISLLAIYRSVLHRARTSLRRAEAMEDVENFRGVVRDAWVRLKDKVDYLWNLRPIYFMARGGRTSCMNDDCITRRQGDTSSRIYDMRCSGCQYAYYCSHQCAKSGWRDGHRAQCLELRRQFREGHPRLMSPNEDEWFIVVGQSEVYRTLDGKETVDALRSAYHDAHPSVPNHSVLTFIDYTVLPGPKIEVMSLQDFVSTRDMGYYHWERYRDLAIERNGFLLGITIPDRDLHPYNCLALSREH